MSSAADRYNRRRRTESAPETTFADLMNGFSFDSGRRKGRKSTPEPEECYKEPPRVAPPRAQLTPQAVPQERYPEQSASIVRAYAWTGGRTRSNFHLEIETLVSANDQGYHSAMMLQAEYQDVIELCRSPRSVAEVAALLKLPLGVARVLLGDMAERGLIDVHETASSNGDLPDLGLMERVLSGLRRL